MTTKLFKRIKDWFLAPDPGVRSFIKWSQKEYERNKIPIIKEIDKDNNDYTKEELIDMINDYAKRFNQGAIKYNDKLERKMIRSILDRQLGPQ